MIIEQINHKIKIKNKFISESNNISDKYSYAFRSIRDKNNKLTN